MQITPLQQNVLAAVATVVYAKSIIALCEVAVVRNLLSSKVSRKIIHVAAGSWLVFWPLFSDEHPSWRLNVVLPAVYSVQLLLKGLFVKDKNDSDVKTMTRTGDPHELLFGPLFFTSTMTALGLFCFRDKESVFTLACLAFGDGIAPLAGGIGSYRTFPFGEKDTKTLSGSVGFFFASIVGFYLLESASPGCQFDLQSISQVAAMCAVTEAMSGKYDNISVALIASYASKYTL
eukprot:scaffold2428_cov97-Cylindrotheca_fusiformis.AAC.5